MAGASRIIAITLIDMIDVIIRLDRAAVIEANNVVFTASDDWRLRARYLMLQGRDFRNAGQAR
jgi:hypothetical protein